MSEEDKLKTNNEKVTIDDYYYYYLLKCEDIVKELEKYKARCEKAREYIQSTYVTDNPIKFKNTLYEILIGSDEE